MKRDQALSILAGHLDELHHMGVKQLWVFGSTARNLSRADSDVDILVELDRNTRQFSLLDFAGIKVYLENILHCSVDLGEPETLRPAFREQVMKEAVRVA